MAKYIPNEKLKEFQSRYEKDDVWQVHTGDTWLTVFLYKNDQLEKNKGLQVYEQMKEEYTMLVRTYLDVPLTSSISLEFDSKENFETKYRGSWNFYYH
jgi:hypothetical protein